MRFYSVLIILFVFSGLQLSAGQSPNFEDGFEDGDFTSYPAWSGNTDDFIITKIDDNHLLQLEAGDSGTSYLSVPSSNIEGSWEFFIKMDFAPSSGNRAYIFLVSDVADLSSSPNGYAIRAGESGSDDLFHLVRFNNGSEDSTLISGVTDISGGGEFRVKVTRNSDGSWILEAGKGYDGKLTTEGTGRDNQQLDATHFGILLNYTSTRSDKFYFDFKIDLPPFSVTSVSANNDEIDVTFNRNYKESTAQTTDFFINDGPGYPNFVSHIDNRTVRLAYSNDITSGRYALTVNDIEDENGEIIASDFTTEFYIFDKFSEGDVVINEFVYDPPKDTEEYIELKNISDKYLNLQNWQIGDDTNLTGISSDTTVLKAESLIVISRDTAALFNAYGNRNYVQATIPFLNNDEDAVRVYDEKALLVDSLFYNSNWGGADVALERRSVEINAIFMENWGNSPDPLGGTPGKENNIAADNMAPAISDLEISSSRSIFISFDERIQKASAENRSNYFVSGKTVDEVQQTAKDTVKLILASNLQNAEDYNLSIHNISDIFGNTISSADTLFTYYEISPVDSGDVAINEFMYDPPSNSTEYVEIHNYSDKSLDLQGWTLSDNRNVRIPVTNTRFIIPPDSFVVLAPDNTLQQEFSDIALVALGSKFPALNNGGDEIVIRDSAGILLDSLEYTPEWKGEEVALERRSTALSAIHQSNWGNSPVVPGTPGFNNEIGMDLQPPALSSLVIRDESTIDLYFSESLDSSTTVNPTNYTLSGNITITDAIYENSGLISVLLDKPLQNNIEYNVSITGISDLFGNAVSKIDTSFTFYKISEADSGDVFINEFMFTPPAGQTEYIELYNGSAKSVNLQGWTLSDNRNLRKEITGSRMILPPDSFVVIAPDNSLQNKFPDIALIEMGNSFPALNNSSDDIVIHTADSTVMDSLRYRSAWGGDEVALERRTTRIATFYQENWGDSPGTPGFQNSIQPDLHPPEFQDLSVVNASTLQLHFSERLTTPSAVDISNYSISPGREIRMIAVNVYTVTLHLGEKLISGKEYVITVNGVEDVFGNAINSQIQEIDYIKFENAEAGELVINEILYRRNSEGGPEFIELYNNSDKNFNLSGWTIGDAAGTATITHNIRFPSGEYIVLTDDQAFAENEEKIFHLPNLPSLNDAGDILYITDIKELTIDSLHYKSSWGGSIPGISLERKDPGSASNDASNWITSGSASGDTAGRKNAGFEVDNNPPKVIFSKYQTDGTIEIHFDEFILLTDDAEFLMESKRLKPVKFNPAEANTILVSPSPTKEISGGSNAVIAINNLSDIRGNTTESARIAVSQPISPGDLVINEIMYNPLSNSDDNLPDQSEYIELRNITDHALSLEGLQLHDAPDENNNLRILKPVTTASRWIPPQGITLVYADESDGFNNSKIAEFFDLDFENKNSKLRVNRATLSLASTGDAIYIADSSGVTIDSVYYDENWQNPNLVDTRGIALERINPYGSGNEADNWGSSINEKGGTPGSENSIYQTPKYTSTDHGISFSPNPFSPDDDGYEDNLFINYALDAPDYLVRIQIYDRYGRLVRKLADGKPAGYEGSIVWDGRRDDGSRNRIGIYIVVFEAYDSSTGKNQAFKETVVLARRL